jgi:hypothetical protein
VNKEIKEETKNETARIVFKSSLITAIRFILVVIGFYAAKYFLG